jgi:hypothetical protein
VRWPTRREARSVTIGLPLIVLGVFVIRGCHSADLPNVSAPPGVTLDTGPSTSSPADLTAVQLAAVDGTTTTAAVRATGTAHMSGVVNGPQGPVPGAVVRVEHLVDGAGPTDVTAGPDGHWDLPGIAGGRYRVRAFLAPTFAQTEPDVFFLNDGDQREEDLTVDQFSGLTAIASVAPDPPAFKQPLNLVVRVANRTVDADGVVQAAPVANASVTLASLSGWTAKGPTTATTNAAGDATFGLQCDSAGANQVSVQVRSTPTTPPQAFPLAVSACTDPAATTTAPTAPGSGSSAGPSSTAPPPPPTGN